MRAKVAIRKEKTSKLAECNAATSRPNRKPEGHKWIDLQYTVAISAG
ncbi:hypothetical protein GA0061098_10903 [Bradyrhizobium shewense]|uniref:Uncharacterized protein n=1 Tax=Bradyrhizobium shewense TaxID=1761772 RepID=A0A1C3XV76_9BRAD|nr:hypothetical protein GA0061098_10903 [Bradyrhizobium shewense]